MSQFVYILDQTLLIQNNPKIQENVRNLRSRTHQRPHPKNPTPNQPANFLRLQTPPVNQKRTNYQKIPSQNHGQGGNHPT